MSFLFVVCLILLLNLPAFSEKLPQIIWWTDKLYPHLEAPTTVSCGASKCEVTTMRKITKKQSDHVAYLFYGSDFDPENLPLPREADDIWALLHEESPMNNYIFSHNVGIRLFNLTATFSRYSDYPLTTQFLPSIAYLTERPSIPTSEKNILRKQGLAPVVYVQSHCNVASDRDTYVAELMKHISVDSYGACLHNKDLPSGIETTESYESSDFLDFLAQYKFVIAFENALCEDYMTEKLFRPLYVGSVPVYWGSVKIKDWDPLEKSIIVVDDFQSPKDLASFLLELDADDSKYEEYLRFKENVANKLLERTLADREWGVNDPDKKDFISGFECFICDSLVSGKDGHLANRSHMNCQQPRPSIELESQVSISEWMQEEWVDRFWYAFDEARAIRMMIDNKENSSKNFFQYMTKLKYAP